MVDLVIIPPKQGCIMRHINTLQDYLLHIDSTVQDATPMQLNIGKTAGYTKIHIAKKAI